MNDIQGSESAEDSPADRWPSGGAVALDQEKLIIYVMTTSVMKITRSISVLKLLQQSGGMKYNC